MRQTTEAWYDDLQDQTANLTYSTTYDTASRVASVSDGNSEWTWDYDVFGQVTTSTQNIADLAGPVTIETRYDAAGRRTGYEVDINGTDDFVNEYDYDALGRVVRITQSGVSGGNSVSEKRADFTYSDDNTKATLTRYADLAGNEMVAATDQIFDELGRVDNITHRRADTIFADYDYTWDAASRITDLAMTFLNAGDNDTVEYDYDDTSQLTAADYTSQTDESYTYDETGNRTMTGYVTGDHNRLLCDGTYYYTYDAEGNRTGKYSDSQRTVAVQKYEWDHRNRLIKVEVYDSGSLDQIVEYAYDYANRRYRRTVDADADQAVDARSIFVYDEVNNQIVLELADDAAGSVTSSDASKRLFYGTNVDQILAEEHVGDDTYYLLTDHLNTVRDVLSHNSGVTTLEQHNILSAFGELLSTPTIETLLLWTGRPFDYVTGLSSHLFRDYDPATGGWTSTDPIGFEAGDVNLYRYVGNGATHATDPSGLLELVRNRGARANVCVEPGDWLHWIASDAQLDVDEFEKWLQPEDGKPLPATKHERFTEVRKFSVPNTLVIIRSEFGWAGWLVGTSIIRNVQCMQIAAEAVGLNVEHVAPADAPTSTAALRSLKNQNVWGYATAGHGYKNVKGGKLSPSGGAMKGTFVYKSSSSLYDIITPTNIRMVQPFRFGTAILFHCWSGNQSYETTVSPISMHFDTPYTVFAPAGSANLGFLSWKTLFQFAVGGP